MTPKQKAEELLDKYSNIRNATYTIIRQEVKNNIAKQCALITVNELIEETGSKFWYDVRHEIEKL